VGDEVIDPRFGFVTRGIAPHWEDLNMRWAMNRNYGEHILSVYIDLMKTPLTKQVQEPKKEEEKLHVGLLNKVLNMAFSFFSNHKKK